jgi:hypothetical protein
MALNPDGTANCDRCGRFIDGYGVLYGMVSADLNDTTVRNLIVCYDECRPLVLDGLLRNNDPTRCADCGIPAIRAVSFGLLATDLDPITGDVRNLTFCYVNGSAAAYLSRLDL